MSRSTNSFDIEGFVEHLTPKQYDVLSCLLFDISSKQIGRTLNISNRTVESHIGTILRKANISHKNDLLKALRLNSNQEIILKMEEHFHEIMGSSPKQRVADKKYWYSIIVLLAVSVCSTIFFNSRTKIRKIDTVVYLLHRESLLEQLSQPCAIKIVFGLGGSGKTTLAREYLHRCKCSVVYEINAESFSSLEKDVTGLAYSLINGKEQRENFLFINSIKNANEKFRQIFAFILDGLKDVKDWCLLFDNVDDFKMLKAFCIDPYQTTGIKNGQILITTRQHYADQYVPNAMLLHVGELSKEEKETLFVKIAGDNRDIEHLSEIPGYPLDVLCCAYYIKNAHISLKEYLERVEKGNAVFWKNSKEILSPNTNYNWTRRDIIYTLLDQLAKTNPNFQALLFTISLFDSQNIPLQLLRKMYDDTLLDTVILQLSKFGLINFKNEEISLHRSTHEHMGQYFSRRLKPEHQIEIIRKIVTVISPYKNTGHKRFSPMKESELTRLSLHLDSCLKKIDKISGVESQKISLMMAIGDIALNKLQFSEALKQFEKALSLRNDCRLPNDGLIELKIGEVYTAMNQNKKALTFLNCSLSKITNPVMLARNYRLLGVIQMRQNQFEKANQSFEKAITLLEGSQGIRQLIAKSDTCSDMAFNYFMNGINRTYAKEAVNIMQKAIAILENISTTDDATLEKIIGRRAIHQIKLAGIYNALGKYHAALDLASRTESLINTHNFKNYEIMYVRGIIARERGLANLRLNNIAEAYQFFISAKKIFLKTMSSDYLFKIKMHEAECLVRLNRLEEARIVCKEMFAISEREKTNYADLFFNTCYYHAAVIEYRMKNLGVAQKYFREFFKSMKEFCRKFSPKEKYEKLIQDNVFDEKCSLKECFDNALKVFEVIYWKDYEFTKYYVERNCI